MKYFTIFLFLLSVQGYSQIKWDEIEMSSIDSQKTSLKEYEGKKIVVATGNQEHLNRSKLLFLDSIQSVYPQLQVIVLPAQSSDEVIRQPEERNRLDSAAKTLKDDLQEVMQTDLSGTNIKVMEPSATSREAGEKQHRLMKYLTTPEENGHFTINAKGDFQLFVLNEAGFLYAVIEGPISQERLTRILTHSSAAKQ